MCSSEWSTYSIISILVYSLKVWVVTSMRLRHWHLAGHWADYFFLAKREASSGLERCLGKVEWSHCREPVFM